MAIKIRDVGSAARKWGEVTPGRSSYYDAGVSAPTKDWAAETVAAAASFKAAVQAGDIDRRFTGGVKRAGTAKWQRKAKDVGVGRFGPGVSAAVADYQTNVAPFFDEISRVTLPPRQPRGSDANIERVRAVAKALAAKRIALKTAGA